MSRQLQISSLFSALALVCLCLAANVQELRADDTAIVEVLVQAETVPGLNS